MTLRGQRARVRSEEICSHLAVSLSYVAERYPALKLDNHWFAGSYSRMPDPQQPEFDAERVVGGYLRYSRRMRSSSDAEIAHDDLDWIAEGELRRVIADGPAMEAWHLVLLLLRRAEDEDELGHLAAGPLEDLVWQRGAELVEVIEAEAARDERFRWALGCVWLSDRELPAEVQERVVAASGGEILLLPPLDSEGGHASEPGAGADAPRRSA